MSPATAELTPRRVSNKRQHSEDMLQPRKRSDSRSPLSPLELKQIADPPVVPVVEKPSGDTEELRRKVCAMNFRTDF